MNINGTTVLITGACGGIGSSLLEEFVQRGSKKIYAASIKMDNLENLQKKYGSIIIPVKLDVTNVDDILACRNRCHDINMLINNAGVECATSFLSERSIKASSLEMAVNYFGVHHLCYAFWDALKEKKSAAIINMLSIASFTLIL